MKKLILVALAVAVCIAPAMAAKKSSKVFSDESYSSNSSDGMTGKIGLGNRTFIGVNGAAVRYYLDDKTALDAGLGFLTAKNFNSLGLGGNVLFIVKETKNLKFAYGPGVQFCNTSVGSVSTSVFEIDFALNVEYFFTELPQLGFNAGLSGLALSFNDGDTSFALGSPITFGIRYYFN